MEIDLGVLGKVEMEELQFPVRWEQGFVTHSGFTEQGIRIHIFNGRGWEHGEMWNNAIMLCEWEMNQ